MLYSFDCVEWDGNRPCPHQHRTSAEDCAGCRFHRPAVVRGGPPPHIQFDPSMFASARSIGIIHLGGLGSILQADVVRWAVHQVNPSAEIVWFTHSRGVELVRHLPRTTPMEASRTSACVRTVRNLDLVVNFSIDERIRPLVEASRCVAGFTVNEYGNFLPATRHAVYFQRLKVSDGFRKANGLSMRNIHLQAAGLENVDTRSYELPMPGRLLKRAESMLRRTGRRPLIGLNIGSSAKGRLKRWPPEHWAELVGAINVILPEYSPVLLSGPEDGDIRRRCLELIRSDPGSDLAVFPDRADIGVFMAAVAKLRVLITNDTFALHAAATFGVPLIGLSGPMPAQELVNGAGDHILRASVECAPCYYDCSNDIRAFCMKSISVSRVVDRLVSLLVEDRSRRETQVRSMRDRPALKIAPSSGAA
ncbi:glycosyltransferase family 9 protein [Glycomyces salinus]|uniref:glycosyltransferase family 9 protein n=1 Tax=Glycomyces salinus TaxID=980294 RepID=UPI0018EB9ED7|nr:glycosyltransferase family 9 protein [Glycomyces salinus]